MGNEGRKRLRRCLGKAVNHMEQAIPAIAEVWQACDQRDKLLAAQPVREAVPILDDDRIPEPSYTNELAVCLEMMDKTNQLIIEISKRMMGMTHDELLALAQRNA